MDVKTYAAQARRDAVTRGKNLRGRRCSAADHLGHPCDKPIDGVLNFYDAPFGPKIAASKSHTNIPLCAYHLNECYENHSVGGTDVVGEM